VYTLLFADTGLSTAEISSLFIIWSVTGFGLEVPSGVLADATSRRMLLVVGPLLAAAGSALWVFAPSYPAFAVGFALWGIEGALRSGALEALVYEELDRVGEAERYPRLIGRASAAETTAAALAMAAAAPVFALGGYEWVGIASVAVRIAASAVATTLPEHRTAATRRTDDAEPPPAGPAAVVRHGIAELRAAPRVRAAILLVPAIVAIWGSLEEYLGLLLREAGAAVAEVPLLLVLVWAGVAAGGLLGERAARLSSRGLALLLAASGAASRLARSSATRPASSPSPWRSRASRRPRSRRTPGCSRRSKGRRARRSPRSPASPRRS
jgi:MFS family permease